MVPCCKRLYLLLFLFLSFGLQAQIENKQATIFSSAHSSPSSLIFNTVVSTFVKNTLISIQQKQNMQFYIVIVFLSLLMLLTGLLVQTYKTLNAQRLLNIKQEEINFQKIDSILKEQELNLIKAWISGQEKERELISQELYNTIGRNLAAIKLQLNHLNNSNLKNITKINLQLEETYKLVRNLSNTMVPKKFSPTKFCDVLDSYLVNLSVASQLKISFLTFPKKEIDSVNEVIQVEVFKIIHDLLHNTIKHAKASQIEIQLNLIENDLSLLFVDNGTNTENYLKGITLLHLESRINKLRGSLIIDYKQKKGTVINIEIPSTRLTTDMNSKFIVKGINLKSQLDELKSRF